MLVKFKNKEQELEILGATLLTINEVENFLKEEERIFNCSFWWLRSPGYDRRYAACVLNDGYILWKGKHVNYYKGSVRPALRISINSQFSVGDNFEIKGYKFKIISKNLAWMFEQDIGEFAYRENWNEDKDEDKGNDYENSDLKKYIDQWWIDISKDGKLTLKQLFNIAIREVAIKQEMESDFVYRQFIEFKYKEMRNKTNAEVTKDIAKFVFDNAYDCLLDADKIKAIGFSFLEAEANRYLLLA